MAAIDQASFSTRAFVEAVRKGEAELSAQFSISGAQSRSLFDAGEPLYRQLEELSVGQAVEVQLDIQAGTGTREFKKMDDLSKGQRATALLLLLLGASNAPLVIDQPEDDLDNRFIYDGIVTHLRKLKGMLGRIQQIFRGAGDIGAAFEEDGSMLAASGFESIDAVIELLRGFRTADSVDFYAAVAGF